MMLMAVLITLILISIFYLQGMPLVRAGQWRELAVFVLLLALSGYFMYSLAVDMYVLNPADFISFLVEQLPVH